MHLHCILAIYLGKSHGAADLFIKGKIAVLPGGWMFLSDSHPRECTAVVQCVPRCFTHIGLGSFGTEALESSLEVLRSLAVEPWAMCVLPEGRRPSWCWQSPRHVSCSLEPQRLRLHSAFCIIQYLIYTEFSGNLLGLGNCIKMVI